MQSRSSENMTTFDGKCKVRTGLNKKCKTQTGRSKKNCKENSGQVNVVCHLQGSTDKALSNLDFNPNLKSIL